MIFAALRDVGLVGYPAGLRGKGQSTIRSASADCMAKLRIAERVSAMAQVRAPLAKYRRDMSSSLEMELDNILCRIAIAQGQKTRCLLTGSDI